VPAKLLFTLPTLSPFHSKFNRVLEICRALDRTRYTPMVSVDHAGRLRPEGQAALESIDVPALQLRMSPHRKQIRESTIEMLQTARRLRELGVVLQHSSDYSNSWSEPLVAKAGGVRHFIASKTNTSFDGIGWRVRLRLAGSVILQSCIIAQDIARRAPELGGRIRVIPNGVRADIYRPRSEGNASTQRPPWFGSNRLVLVCVAHLVSWKDQLSLVRAMEVGRRRSSVLLCLVGEDVDAGYASDVRATIQSRGLCESIVWLGPRGDIAGFLPLADGIVLTSSSNESLSNAVLEGMACGLPVICSDVGGMRDLARPGINGWLVQRGPDFVEKLAEAIDEWADDEDRRQEYGRASRRIVEREFSIEEMVRKHIELYDSLLK
jgi:glycosyltransferase involved in cell wall biosynthesis